MLTALHQAPRLTAREGERFRLLVLVDKQHFEPHGVAFNSALVDGGKIARQIVFADRPTVLRSICPTRREFTFGIGLDRFQHVAVRAIELQGSALWGDFHADVPSAPHIGRCTRVLSLWQVRCRLTREHESSREHDQENTNPLQPHSMRLLMPLPRKPASILVPWTSR